MKPTAKKALALTLALSLGLGLAACGKDDPSSTPDSTTGNAITLKVGASPSPHGDILKVVQPILAEEGIDLQIVEFTDYVQPNLATEDGSLDANFFQHTPYLDQFNQENETHLISVGGVHFEPMGIYPGKTAAVKDLANGALVGIPNDATNEARALLLLQEQGLITLPEDADLNVTPKDILDNPKNLKFQEMEAVQLPLALEDLDIAVINGNYAVTNGIQDTVLVTEGKEGLGAQTYQNILVVKEGNENNEAIQKLYAALTSDAVKDYIQSTYTDQSVIPAF